MNLSIELVVVLIIFGLAAIGGLITYILKVSSSKSKIETAKRFMKVNDFNKAINILKSIISKNDVNSECHYLLGECYYMADNYEWALPEYKKVLRLHEYEKEFDEATVRRKIANIYLHYKQLEEAQKEFAMVTKLDPDNYENYYEMGKIFIERDHIDKAKPYLQKALTINPNHVNSLYYMGFVSFKLKLFSEALNSLGKCISIDKKYIKAYYYIGMINFLSRNYQAALKNFDFSIRDRELKLNSLYHRGLVYANLNDINHAQAEFEKALTYVDEEGTLSLNIRYQLANCHEMKKDITDAIEQWEKIISVKPNFRNVKEKLSNYSELRMDDKLKDFFIASNKVFEQKVIEILQKLNIEVATTNYIRGTSIELIADERFGGKDIRVQKILVRVYRNSDPLGEKIIRDMVDKIKAESGVQRGLCISATGYTKQAIEFAENRSVSMMGIKELSKLLKEI